mmetsp:Transcript_12249/g.15905  ORF Transcript_12249/g.15905 Transcript_12249/m.15905 type:complete len:112 (+) Transcript_12249:123-458(+)
MDPNQQVRVRNPGENVRRFLAREEELRAASQHCSAERTLRSQSEWVERSAKNVKNIRAKTAIEEQKNELILMNAELKMIRQARLKEFYDQLNEQYEKELNAKGLSFVRDRL